MKYRAGYIFLGVVLCFVFMATQASFVRAQGYQGLIAAPPDSDTQTGAAPGASGYSGVMAGHVDTGTDQTNAQPTPEMTTAPGIALPAPVRTVRQLQDLGIADNLEHGPNSMEAFLRKRARANPNAASMKPSGLIRRENGVLPMEGTTKKMIDTVMTIVANDKLPLALRQKNARQAYARLSQYAAGMSILNAVSPGALLRAGMTQGDVALNRQDTQNSLQQVNAALQLLRPLQ